MEKTGNPISKFSAELPFLGQAAPVSLTATSTARLRRVRVHLCPEAAPQSDTVIAFALIVTNQEGTTCLRLRRDNACATRTFLRRTSSLRSCWGPEILAFLVRCQVECGHRLPGAGPGPAHAVTATIMLLRQCY
jgi:hypothetical protein